MGKKYLEHIKFVIVVAEEFSCQNTKTEKHVVNVA
jgi:hypothetical protein